jgi:hypothetical protein
VEIVWQAEDSLREKKLESDLKDLLKTLVAFANSVAPSDTAQIFIGEHDDGSVQGVSNADNIQKSVKKEADKIYPEIYYKTEVYERDGKHCVRVDIKHNGLAPHFGGAAWVRRGPTTVKATEQLFQQMVDFRQEKVRVLALWLNKSVTVEGTSRKPFMADAHSILAAEWSTGVHLATILAVNSHWVTFRVRGMGTHQYEKSEPMEKVLLSWDDERNQPKVLIKHWPN